MIFHYDDQQNLVIELKINNSLKLLLIRFFKIIILCMLTGIIIYTTINYMGWFPGLFTIIILTALFSILTVNFFDNLIHYYFLFPLLINLAIGVAFWNQVTQINGIQLFIQGCIYGICVIVGNFIISVLAVRFYLKKGEQNEKN